MSIPAVNAIPPTPLTTPIAPIYPVAPKTPAPASQVADGSGNGGGSRPQSANPSGVGARLDITV